MQIKPHTQAKPYMLSKIFSLFLSDTQQHRAAIYHQSYNPQKNISEVYYVMINPELEKEMYLLFLCARLAPGLAKLLDCNQC